MIDLRADDVTSSGEVRTIGLADGSSVTLAPDSAIKVAYTGTERRVMLLSGEAFFTVRHDPARPFRVAAGGIETTDIGTTFDVRRGNGGVAIAVQDGSVEVDDRAAEPPVSEILRGGQRVRVTWSGEVVRSGEPPGQVAAWRQYQLIAQDQPMGEVIDQLRPYFRGRIILTNGTLAARPVTGVYNLSDPVEALRGLVQAHGATVRRVTPWLLLVSGG
ncbi:MAG TPA: FecR domain-containing protein [Rhodopila sp.]